MAPRHLALVLLLVAGCSGPEHTNPYDPQSPASAQARAMVAGVVQLEAAGGVIPALSGVAVSLVGPSGSHLAVTDGDGAFLVSEVRPGTYTLHATRSGYRDGALTGIVVTLDDGGRVLRVPDLLLAAGRGSIAGRILLSLPHGIEEQTGGAAVSVEGLPGAVLTDLTGAFLLEGVPAGSSYTLTASKLGYVGATLAGVAVSTDGISTGHDVALAADLGWVDGLVTVVGAESPAGVLVRARGVTLGGTPWEESAFTDAAGTFLVSGLPAGSYTVSYELPRHHTVTALATVSPGAGTTLEPVTLTRTRAQVTGSVTLSAGAVGGFAVELDRPGIVVTISDGGVAVAPSAVTDGSGAYTFPDVPVVLPGGTYLVTARKANYASGTASVAPALPQSTPAPGITLAVAASTLSGTAASYDNLQHDGTVNANGAGNRIDISGTAFNGTAYSATAFTDATGAWTAPNLPAGTWDVVATSTGRTCAAIPRTVLGPAATVSTAAILCTDAVAPTAPSLATPAGTGAQPGYTRTTSLAVPVTLGTDAVNLRGHEYVVGATPGWSGAARVDGTGVTTIPYGGLVSNATNVLWVRAVDWVGNAGPAATATVVHDDVPPPATVLQTPRPYVDATTTSVTLGGADKDLNFLGYQSCSWTQPATLACPGSCACTYASCTCAGAGGSCTLDGSAASSSAFAVSLTANQRTCVFARGVDRAGNAGAVAAAAITSDLTLPTPPVMAPAFDPTLVTVHADYVDFFVSAAAKDDPVGGNTSWKNVAWLEVDTGTGFTPLCPADACHPNDTYAPCGCGCTDPRLLCSGGTFLGVRMPLLGGVTNLFQVRATDIAGNRGAGLSQQVMAARSATAVQVTSRWDHGPRTLGSLLTVSSTGGSTLYELGPDQRLDATDKSCTIGSSNGRATYPAAQPASATLVVYSDPNRVVGRRPGAAGFCDPGYVDTTVRTAPVPGGVFMVTASGERASWVEQTTASAPYAYTVYVQEPGSNGKLGGPASPPPAAISTYSNLPVIQLQGSALLVREPSTSLWKVYNAVGAFSASSPSYTFPASVVAAALSSDGRMLATFDSAGTLTVRRPGPSGRYDGLNDVTSSRLFSTPIASGSVAVEGTHAVAFDEGTTSSVYHWDAGGDAQFGTTDDTSAKLLGTSQQRFYPSFGTGLASGVLYFQIGRTNTTGENPDVWALDLSGFRWDSPPLPTYSTIVLNNRAGTTFMNLATGGLTARTSDGRQASLGASAFTLDADGADLVVVSGASVLHYGPDATGLWFTAGAQPALTIYSAASGGEVAVGGGKAIVLGTSSSVQVLEPGAGTLRSGVTPVRIDSGTMTPTIWGVAIAGPHAFYGCYEGTTLRACYRWAGPDGTFGTADDGATAYLRNPSGVPYYGVQSLKAQGRRLVFSPSYGKVFVLDPGADGVFNTADDVETDLGASATQTLDYDLAGDFAAWIDASVGPGPQIVVRNLATGAQRQLTTHYSPKSWVNVQPSGRVAWRDLVFTPSTVFVSTP